MLAVVNGSEITRYDLDFAIRKLAGEDAAGALDEKAARKVLESLVLSRAISQLQQKELTAEEQDQIAWYVYRDRAYVHDSIGNMTWGAIMKHFGWPLNIAKFGAGIYQTKQDWRNDKFNWWQFMGNITSGGDDFRDSMAIKNGYGMR